MSIVLERDREKLGPLRLHYSLKASAECELHSECIHVLSLGSGERLKRWGNFEAAEEVIVVEQK